MSRSKRIIGPGLRSQGLTAQKTGAMTGVGILNDRSGQFSRAQMVTIPLPCSAPMDARNTPKQEAGELAMHFLTKVKIPDQASTYPDQLSCGQQQLCCYSALCMKPRIMLFDEPKSALDPENDQRSAQYHDRASRAGRQTMVDRLHPTIQC